MGGTLILLARCGTDHTISFVQAGNEIDAVSIAFSQNNVMPSQNNVMPSRHVTCGLIEAMVNGELRYIIGGRSNGGMGGLTGELPARRFDAERGIDIIYIYVSYNAWTCRT